MFEYNFLMGLTDREIHNLLMKRGIRGADAQAIRNKVKEKKLEIRQRNARKKSVQELWSAVLQPLTNEQRTVRAMLNYESKRYPNPERREALNAYAALLKKLRLKLREYRYYGIRTPKEQAEYEKEKGKIIPNNGSHWTDWVPEHIKNAIAQAFADIPHHFRAKTKTPFERTMPKTDNMKLREKHIKTARQALVDAEQEIGMLTELHQGEDSEAKRDAEDRALQMRKILDWLIYSDETTVIPFTWAEVLQYHKQEDETGHDDPDF